MKKLISIVAGSLLSVACFANVATVTVAPGAFSLLIAGPSKVTQLISVGTTATNSSALLVDAATNTMTYVLGAYTNTVSYLTNQPVIYTNYWGVLNTNANSGGTNIVLVDVSNTVAVSTNSLSTVAVSAIGNQTVVYNNLNQYFFRGLWVTNTGSGNMQVTASFIPQ